MTTISNRQQVTAKHQNPTLEYPFDLTIIIVAWNVKELLDECLAALRRSDDDLQKEILLVDNGSVDGTAAFVKAEYPEVEIIESPRNLGFIRANNLAYERAKGEYVLMLNSDAFVSASAIKETVNFIRSNPHVGAVGARLVGRDGALQPSARYFPTPVRFFAASLGLDGKLPFVRPLDDLKWDHKSIRQCDWVVGCYLLARASAIEEAGYFLREDYFMYNDDNDLCKRLSALGYSTYFYPIDVVHLGGANVKKMHKKTNKGAQVEEHQLESQMIYFRKNHGFGTVVAHYVLLMLLDLILAAKALVRTCSEEPVLQRVGHARTVTRILLNTKFGASSGNR